MPRYHITLTAEEREQLDSYRQGRHRARSALIATALLMLDEGPAAPERVPVSVEQAAKLLNVSDRSLNTWKRKFVEDGIDVALERKQRDTPPRPIVFDGDFEAKLIALACTEPPEGHARWTVRLLAAKVVELGIVESVSAMTVQRVLKKTHCDLASRNIGRSGRVTTPKLGAAWRICLMFTSAPTTRVFPSCAWMNPASN